MQAWRHSCVLEHLRVVIPVFSGGIASFSMVSSTVDREGTGSLLKALLLAGTFPQVWRDEADSITAKLKVVVVTNNMNCLGEVSGFGG
jgi:hypothetical protein